MSHMYITDECEKCTYYSRFIQDSNAWECEFCHLMEQGYKDPHDSTYDILWGRYQLQCGHQYHIRCLRKWCKEIEQVACRVCGPICEIESNQFCNCCDTFGHSTASCTK